MFGYILIAPLRRVGSAGKAIFAQCQQTACVGGVVRGKAVLFVTSEVELHNCGEFDVIFRKGDNGHYIRYADGIHIHAKDVEGEVIFTLEADWAWASKNLDDLWFNARHP
jgi:hypothetical protein